MNNSMTYSWQGVYQCTVLETDFARIAGRKRCDLMPAKCITVLVADDAEIIRKAIKKLLAQEARIRLVGEAVNFGEAISKASILKPDVLLLDLHMPDDRTLEPAYIKSHLEPLSSKIIGMSLSGSDDEETRNIGESLGALAILEKGRFYTELIPAILRCA